MDTRLQSEESEENELCEGAAESLTISSGIRPVPGSPFSAIIASMW